MERFCSHGRTLPTSASLACGPSRRLVPAARLSDRHISRPAKRTELPHLHELLVSPLRANAHVPRLRPAQHFTASVASPSSHGALLPRPHGHADADARTARDRAQCSATVAFASVHGAHRPSCWPEPAWQLAHAVRWHRVLRQWPSIASFRRSLAAPRAATKSRARATTTTLHVPAHHADARRARSSSVATRSGHPRGWDPLAGQWRDAHGALQGGEAGAASAPAHAAHAAFAPD
jgi:hypothetical protein